MSARLSQRSSESPQLKSGLKNRIVTPYPSGSKMPPESVLQSGKTSQSVSEKKSSPKDSSSESEALIGACQGCRNCKAQSETASSDLRWRATKVSSESESVEYILSTRSCYTSRSFASED